MENNQEWISVGDPRLRVRAPLPSRGVGGGNGADRAETDLMQQDGNIEMFDDDITDIIDDIERLIQQVGGNIGMYDDDITDILDDFERLIQQDGGGVLGFGAVPASASYLCSLPSTLYSEICAAAEAEEQNCSICFEELVASDRVTELPCSHVFHTDCIVLWLQNSHLCPLCRHPLPVNQ